MLGVFFFFKQKTAYELRISDWSSDVCSSDLELGGAALHLHRSVDPEGDEDRRSDVDEGEEAWTLGGRGAQVARLGAGAPKADGREVAVAGSVVGGEHHHRVAARVYLLHQPTEHLIGRAERLLEQGRVAPPVDRPETRSVGKEGGSTCSTR